MVRVYVSSRCWACTGVEVCSADVFTELWSSDRVFTALAVLYSIGYQFDSIRRISALEQGWNCTEETSRKGQ